jgi:6-phosphogluconolactonase (cycloisomerase 2 family)
VFVANFNGNSVTEYARGASGDVAPIADISGSATRINVPGAVAVDASGHVFVANFNGNSVTEYARGASGDVAPVADISGSATGLSGPAGVWVPQ